MDLIREGIHGRLAAMQDGKYTHAPLPDPKMGPRKVDVHTHVQLEALPAALLGAHWVAADADACAGQHVVSLQELRSRCRPRVFTSS